MTGDKQVGKQEGIVHHSWIDLVRVVAVFQVVLVHLSYVIFFKDELPPSDWAAANFYDSLSRMGVPLFFMVSGFLLLGKSEPVSDFFRKRFVKVGIPALFWSVFYLFFAVAAYRNGTMSPFRILLSMLKTMYLGDVEIHLWFLYILLGIYLVAPLLRVFVSAASQRDLAYFAIMWFVATPFLEVLQFLTGFKTALDIPVVAGYVGYFMLGYLLRDVRLSRRGWILSVLGIVVAVAITFIGTGLLSAGEEHVEIRLYSYFSLPTVLASICGFLVLKDLGKRLSGKAGTAMRIISAASFGIYLIHILVVDLLRTGAFGFRLYSWMGPAWYMIPLTGLLVFLVSFAFVYILRKIPVLKMLVP